jgi:hypothetical protein
MQHLDLVGSSSVQSGFMVSYHVYLVNKFDFEDPLIHRNTDDEIEDNGILLVYRMEILLCL